MRHVFTASTLAAAIILVAWACVPAGGDDGAAEGEGENEIVDSGVGEEGEGEGEGEGEQTVQGEPYTTGTAEDGVVCDAVTCAEPNASCCVSFTGATCGAPGSCAASFALEAACDGAEDCDVGQECCFVGILQGTACVAADACRTGGGREICVTGADCVDGAETCCSSTQLEGFGMDGGICLPNEDNCALSFTPPPQP